MLSATGRSDGDRQTGVYHFAECCSKQKDEKLWNAVGVSFYEHLCDFDETFSGFTKWTKKEIYRDIRNLLNHLVHDEKMKILDDHYNLKSPKKKYHYH